MRPMRLLFVVAWLLVGCGRPEGAASVASQGRLVAGASACSDGGGCASGEECVRFHVQDAGSYCSPNENLCGPLVCEAGAKCICHLVNPRSCGCNPP